MNQISSPYPGALDADRPCADLQEDLLDRKGMVRGLSQAILDRTDREPLVFSIQGPWGSGKSSFLNFLGRELEGKEGIVLCRFDPWWFSRADDLMVRFFHQLQAALGRTSNSGIQRAAEVVGGFARLLRPLGLFVPGWTEVATGVEKSAETISKASETVSGDIWSVRHEMEQALEAARATVVVLIDDLDRLTPAEVRTVFRLVKGVSALRGLVHVIAFDQAMVADCLTESGGTRYLDKIIQCPVELSPPTQRQLQTSLRTRLEPILGPDLDSIRWANLFHEAICPFLQTFRDVKRLANACYTTYPIVKDEVVPLDFVAVQAARIFYPELYQMLLLYSNGPQDDELQLVTSLKSPEVFLKEVMPKEQEEVLQRFLPHLFPNSPADLRSLRRNLPAYLRLTPEEGVISNRQWGTLRQSLEHGATDLIDFIRADLTNSKLLDSVLPRLEMLVHEEGLSGNITESVITAILETGDEISENSESSRFISLPIGWALNRILLFGLRQFPVTELASRLLRLVTAPKAGPVVIGKLTQAAENRDLLNEVYPPPAVDTLNKLAPRLRRIVVGKIRQQSQSGELWNKSRNLLYLVAFWQEWGPPGQATHWLRAQVNTSAEILAKLVFRSFGSVTIQAFSDWKGQ